MQEGGSLHPIIAQRDILRQSVRQTQGPEGKDGNNPKPELQELPFVVLSTDITADMLCEVTPDNNQVYFKSSLPMDLYPDWEVLYTLNSTKDK